MKRFVWRLQRVLDIKEKEERKVRTELFKVAEKLAETRGELLIRQKMLQDLINELAEESPKARIGKQEFFLKFSATSDAQIKTLKDHIRLLEQQKKEKIAEVLRIRRFKQGLEKLREETKRQFIAEQEKLEQKELDERAGVAFVRKAQC
ncbi:MAG: flagellar FliJ family protein [Sedimentisphaerales bacterium]|nr:flagellar FliJ family protein [Sedimentisphaerales bacterium]